MKRFVTTLLVGASLAAMAVSGARAEIFTMTRFTTQPGGGAPLTTITVGGVSVNFLNIGIESPPADNTPPGTSVVLLNYTVTAPAAAPNTVFNEAFELNVLWESQEGGMPTDNSLFTGTITGSASSTQDNLVVTLTPLPGATDIQLNGPMSLFNLQRTLPPIINDTANPGAVSAQVVGAIPEPGSMALLGTAVLPFLGLARRRRK